MLNHVLTLLSETVETILKVSNLGKQELKTAHKKSRQKENIKTYYLIYYQRKNHYILYMYSVFIVTLYILSNTFVVTNKPNTNLM